jgi:hypothetical protein
MKYTCPQHKRDIPQTYGEVSRDGDSEDERGALLKANGRPDMTDGILTSAIVDWNIEVATGERCWYCGVRRPRSGCCGAAIDRLASLPLCVRCNGILNFSGQPFPGRHEPGHNERCLMKAEN